MTTIKVLVVDDSAVVRDFFVHLLRSDPGIASVAIARDGVEAIEAVRTLKPHIVTMDLHMPRMNGAQAIRQIMQTQPTPIVVRRAPGGRCRRIAASARFRRSGL
jgi:two-component system, chemotaxis family, protein-glutamate methylesterase/glutaminase